MPLWLVLIFVGVAGACVGSFLNVVILRLPSGESIVSPPSACPKCGHKLAWFENVPIVSWLALRGRCRSCRAPISAQYPLIEALTAILFAGLTAWYYLTPQRPAMLDAGLMQSWPVLIMHLVLVGGLLAATAIDIKYYIIPITIPWVITLVALLGYPLAAGLGLLPPWLDRTAVGLFDQIVPVSSPAGLGAAMGGGVGLVLALGLVYRGVLPRSFDDESASDEPADALVTDPEQMIAHPHPRREVLKEAAFLLLPIFGMVLGALLVPAEAAFAKPLAVRVAGGVALGYLVGAGLVWVTRVLGTLAFGKEAMGLGDVHLLAAIGAVLGGIDAVFVFFIAPFVGIFLTLAGNVASLMKRRTPRVIPFGPSLAAGALVMLLFREPILGWFFLP
jgi:leader peptidase (prepilin peptidase)/N-methyltransferase